MTINTECYECKESLLFREPSGAIFSSQGFELILTYQNDQISECRLKVQIDLEKYRHVENEQIFNLKASVRGLMHNGAFAPDRALTMIAVLNPDFLPRLTNHGTIAQQAAEYLVQLSHSQPNARLIATESWLGVSVQQDQTGYRTLWDYVEWDLPGGSDFSQAIFQAIPKFALDAISVESGETAQDRRIKAQMIEAIAQATQTLSATASAGATGHLDPTAITAALSNFSQTSMEALWALLDVEPEDCQEIPDLTHLMKSVMPEGLLEGLPDFFHSVPQSTSLWQTVVEFFQDHQWSFSQVLPSVLQLPFEGENGTWDCQAQVWETEKRFNFYSVMPSKVPESKRRDIAEFLTRTNYGLLLGNFELDFADGEIRYKTSIDVEGSRLDAALIRQLVHTNVLTMDHYLPGILQLLNQDAQLEKIAA
jgi:hypothetical protein